MNMNTNVTSPSRPVERLIRIGEVKRLTGLSTATIYRKIATGDFPKPVPLGAQARGWLLSEVQDWIAGRVAARSELHHGGRLMTASVTPAERSEYEAPGSVAEALEVGGKRLLPKPVMDRMLTGDIVIADGKGPTKAPDKFSADEPARAQPADRRGTNRATSSRRVSSPAAGRRKARSRRLPPSIST
jgi:prophage regulatory protein